MSIILESNAASIIIPIVVVVLVVIVIYVCYTRGIQIIKERETAIVESMGAFKETCRTYDTCYYEEDIKTERTTIKISSSTRISQKEEVLNFPKQTVITLDNASVKVDAVMNYVITDGRTMIYSIANLPDVLSQMLQAHLRNVTATMTLDQLVGESDFMMELTRRMNEECTKWGARVNYVKISQVDAGDLEAALAKTRNADLDNRQLITNAKADKQTSMLEAEGQRDSRIKQAEGHAQNIIAKAKGEADSLINAAQAEAQMIAKVAPSIAKTEVLTEIASQSNTDVKYLPSDLSKAAALQRLGVNSVIPTLK